MTNREIKEFYARVADTMQGQAAWLDAASPLMWLAEICSNMGRIATRIISSTNGYVAGIREALVETAALIVAFNEWLKPRSFAARGLQIDWTQINVAPNGSSDPMKYYPLIVEQVGAFITSSNVLRLANAYAYCAIMWEKLGEDAGC